MQFDEGGMIEVILPKFPSFSLKMSGKTKNLNKGFVLKDSFSPQKKLFVGIKLLVEMSFCT